MYSLNSKIKKVSWLQRLKSFFSESQYRVDNNLNAEFGESLLNEIQQLVCIKNKDGRYVYANLAFSDMVDLPMDSIIGKNDKEIGFFLNPRLVQEADAKVFESGQKKHIPIEPYTDKYGNLYWFQTTKTPLKNKNGEVQEILVISNDITSNLAVQQKLSTSELRYRSIFENNYSGIIVINRDLKITNKNKAFNKLVDLPYARLITDELSNYISKEDQKDLKDLMLGLFARNYEYFDLSLQLNTSSGKILSTLCFVRGLYDQYGNFTEAVVTFQDITTEIESHKELEQSENRFRSIFDNATEGLMLLDFDTKRYIDANNSAEVLFGYSKQELLELRLGDLSPLNQGDGRDSTYLSSDYMQKAVQGEKITYEWIVRRKDGRLVPCEVRLAKLPYKDRTIVRTSIIDITERKKAEHLLNLEKRKLQESNQELIGLNHQLANQTSQLQEFAYISSHNLRSPAGNIRALLDFYNTDASSDNLRLFLEKLDIVSTDLMDTINELALVVKIKNELAPELGNLSLAKLVDKAADSLSEQIKSKKAVITINFDNVHEIQASKTYMDSIFLNLISNALKYSNDDVIPALSISSGVIKDQVVLEFKDNGLGIDLNKFGSKIFGLRKTFHRNKDSNGVGLFITKAQVEAMKGTITVKSTPNVGSTFTIYLPKKMIV
jgi:PAS domain S-box-containing protein